MNFRHGGFAMEYFDVVDDMGNPTGVTVERSGHMQKVCLIGLHMFGL